MYFILRVNQKLPALLLFLLFVKIKTRKRDIIFLPPFAPLYHKKVVAEPDEKAWIKNQKKCIDFLWLNRGRVPGSCKRTNDQKKICDPVMHLWAEQRDDRGEEQDLDYMQDASAPQNQDFVNGFNDCFGNMWACIVMLQQNLLWH